MIIINTEKFEWRWNECISNPKLTHSNPFSLTILANLWSQPGNPIVISCPLVIEDFAGFLNIQVSWLSDLA